jgi:hypothetical protein
MTKPMIREHNTETDEVIDREMNTTEFAQYKIDKADAENRAAEAEARAQARAELFERLGISADEAKLLLA